MLHGWRLHSLVLIVCWLPIICIWLIHCLRGGGVASNKATTDPSMLDCHHWIFTHTSLSYPYWCLEMNAALAGVSCSSVAEYWHGKPKALGSTRGSSTEISFLFFRHFQKVHRLQWHMIGSLIRPSQSVLRQMFFESCAHRTAVISLNILSNHMHVVCM